MYTKETSASSEEATAVPEQPNLRSHAMTVNIAALSFVCLYIVTIGVYEYLLQKTKKEGKEKIRVDRDELCKKTTELDRLKMALNKANSLLEQNPTTCHLNKRGLIAHLSQRTLFGQEMLERQSTIIRTTIISIHLRYRGIHALESEYRDHILATLLRILQEHFPSEIATIGHFNDGSAVNGCIEKICIVCRQIDNASDRARTAAKQFQQNTTSPLLDTLSVAIGIYTFNTKSYAIWETLKKFQSGSQTAKALVLDFVLDILENLKRLSEQADDWTIREIAIEPKQTAIATKV